MSRISRRRRSVRSRTVQKPQGILHPRVEKVGPRRFGVVCFDCHKSASKWMLADFYGNVLLEPARVRHTKPELNAAVETVQRLAQQRQLKDLVVAVERTGNYHLPVKRCFSQAGFDTRIVHPFATRHHRLPADAGNKTDDTDLNAIFRATIAGYGLIEQELDETYACLRLLARHRRDLVCKRTILCCQIREHLEAVFPGYAELFDDLWRSSVALCLATSVESVQQFRKLGVNGLDTLLRQRGQRFQRRILDRIVAWSRSAATPHPQASTHRNIALTLEEDRREKCRKIEELERNLASVLVRTPYVLLLSHPGVNVVSAAELAAEMGPIEHYPSAKSITGRAGLFPSRHQSDQLDLADGPLVRQANRRLRAILLLIADNLIKCNGYFRGLASLWKCQGKDARASRIKVASRFSRIAYQIVAGRQVHTHPCQRGRDHILHKLMLFHANHPSSRSEAVTNLQSALEQLPQSAFAAEAEAIQTLKRRGPTPIGEIVSVLLAKLGASDLQSDVEDQGPG